MVDKNVLNKKSPKYYVKRHLLHVSASLEGKTVIDVPAGNGVTSEILHDLGAKVMAFDLFPEFFVFEKIPCRKADVSDHLPCEANTGDLLICQEGLEHFPDPLKALREFNRVLKKGGQLLITTPSHTNLEKKVSYLLFESETARQMPANEIDDIWALTKGEICGVKHVYYGHIFLLGIQKLRVLAKLSGFVIREVKFTRFSRTSLLLFPFLYPPIVVSSLLRYFRLLRKHDSEFRETARSVYKDQLRLNLNPKNLLDKHTFIIFDKQYELDEVPLHQRPDPCC